MKDRTKEASGLLRIVAGVVLLIGMIFAVILILIGAMTIVSGNNALAAGVFRTTGVLLLIWGFVVALTHLAIYAILNGFSVIVENSDRSEMENALFEIADRLGETTRDEA